MELFVVNTGKQLEPGIKQEWLLTNGTGAYSSSTVVGCNTRRYHGLLCAATLPPVGRIMTLSRVGELLNISGSATTHELSVNQFQNNFHPHGEQYLQKFEIDQVARWHFEVEGVSIIKELQLFPGQNLIGLRYIVKPNAGQSIQMKVLPFVAMRDFHSLRQGTGAQFGVESMAGKLRVSMAEHTLYIQAEEGTFTQAADWWRGHFYAIDAERGQEALEDLFVPGYFEFKIDKPTTLTLWAGLGPIRTVSWDTTDARRSPAGETSKVMRKLNRAASDFVVARKTPEGLPGSTVIAGYPWFADWGRDTMISLPGLLLETNRLEEARQVLTLFSQYVSQGMIPNRFDDYSNEPTYNTVDASLWFIQACFEYFKKSKDSATFEKKLLPACQAIVDGYSKGTRYLIRMDSDGLITQGDASTQLTWMDAKCGGVAFTPRQGKAVEINALWYNALRLLKNDALADRVRDSFIKLYWINPFRGLCDAVDGDRRDQSIRPNQIFAVSLPFSPLSEEQQAAVVEVVRRELLTPYGLRTLSPADPNYRSRYIGDQYERDSAYHNGTIWPWLIGPFLESYLRVNKHSAQSVTQAKAWLQPLIDAMDKHGCIGQIAEIYEAMAPHRPVGCFAQAWSIAEVLRIAAILKC